MQTNARVWRAAETNPVKRYLMEYHTLVCRRDALLLELERLREATQRVTSHMGAQRLSGLPNHNTQEDAMLRVVDGQARLAQVVAHIDESLAVRLALIDRLQDERHKTLLTLRYIRGLTWEAIGYQMHYERTQVFEIHNTALEEARGVMAG